MKMPFQRAITKKEQADMGKLKKSVRGLVVVHPMTALGREMGLEEMTDSLRLRFKPSDDWYDRINPHLACVSWSMRGLCLLA